MLGDELADNPQPCLTDILLPDPAIKPQLWEKSCQNIPDRGGAIRTRLTG
jgi:hypothetical protein